MAPIVDGISPNLAPAVGGKRAFVPPSPTPSERGHGREARSVGRREAGPRIDLGRRFQARDQIVAEATQTREYDKKLGRVASDLEGAQIELEQVKLYPPYPIDEPRRAQAIRQFNGIAEEAARLVANAGGPRSLSLSASTDEATAAVAHLGALGTRIEAERSILRANGPTPADVAVAAATSLTVGQGLGEVAPSRIAGGSGDVLRQIA